MSAHDVAEYLRICDLLSAEEIVLMRAAGPWRLPRGCWHWRRRMDAVYRLEAEGYPAELKRSPAWRVDRTAYQQSTQTLTHKDVADAA